MNVPFLWQNTVKKPRTTKYLYTVVLQECGSTVTKTVQLTLKQSRGSNARINNRLETIPSNSPTPPGSPVVKVSQRAGHFPVSSLGNHQWVNATGRQKREDGKALVWQTWQDYYLRVLSWSSQNISCFLVFDKKMCLRVGEVWRKVFLKHNYCHACHTVFAVLFPLQSSCCVSSLLARGGDSEGDDVRQYHEAPFWTEWQLFSFASILRYRNQIQKEREPFVVMCWVA